MKSIRPVILLMMVFAIVLTACSPEPDIEASPEIVAIGNPTNGRTLFRNGGDSGVPCASCHTLDEQDLVGPGLAGIATHAETRIEGMTAEDYLHNSITHPGDYLVDGFENTMNSNYSVTLSESDINDLVAYLLTIE